MEDAPLHSVVCNADCVSEIVNECGLQRADIGRCRAASKCLLHAVASTLERLDVQHTDIGRLCCLLDKLPALRHLKADGIFVSLKNYGGLSAVHAQLEQQLAAHTRLTSLTISSSDLRHLGALKWAHEVATQAAHSTRPASSSSSSSSSRARSKWHRDASELLAFDSQHEAYWLPDWLAAPPALNTLTISSPASSSSSSSSSSGFSCPSPTVPVRLLLRPVAWCNKLTSLEVHDIPFQGCPPHSIAQLVGLTKLVFVGCALQHRAAAQLIRQVGSSCKGLQMLCMAHCDMWQLPTEGWAALAGLKELDLSHNQLVLLPSSLSHLSQLTSLQLQHNQLSSVPAELAALAGLQLFDASHNWLSGPAPGLLASLVAGWPHLRVLRMRNVSDKRGYLVLPAELAACGQLQEVTVGHNYDLNIDSLEVLAHCKTLRKAELPAAYGAAAAVPPSVKRLLTRLQSQHVHVVWG